MDQEGRPLGAYPTLYRPYNIVWRDDRAYVFDRGVGLQIVSTAADESLNVVGSAAFDAPYGHLRLALSGERAFAAANNAQADKATLYAVDIRNVAALIVQSVAETPFIEALAVDDNVLYLAACEQGVLVYDVAANLTQTGALPSQDCSNGMLVNEGKLYVADGEGGLVTYALQVASPPREVSRQPWPFSIPDSPLLVATGAYLYVTYDNAYVEESDPAMLIYDLADPAAPRQIASLNEPHLRPLDVNIAEDRLYIGDERGFLWVFDVSDPARPALRYQGLLDNAISGVVAQGDQAVVVAGEVGLYLFEMP